MPKRARLEEDDDDDRDTRKNKELVLTSDKRRGVYECDYCGQDISQVPRIRCAVCDDFDLCCDCFSSTDPDSAMARWRAVHGGQSKFEHNPRTHGYLVCDSTRWPLFLSKQSLRRKNLEEAVDESKTEEGDKKEAAEPTSSPPEKITLGEEPKFFWTVEEDLRLLRGIEVHGLGNWVEISESVVGPGSVGKTPKRCMERYLDDFMGRFGQILPPYTLQHQVVNATTTTTTTPEVPGTPAKQNPEEPNEAETPRSSKRRSMIPRSPAAALMQLAKTYQIVPSDSEKTVEMDPFLPRLPRGLAQMGQEVGRDVAARAEQTYVRTIAALNKVQEVEQVRQEWETNRLNQPGGPTVLPMRPEDVPNLPGADVAGFMPRRGDFDIEWENAAEEMIADMEFAAGESAADQALKLKVLEIYNAKLDEREKRKQFVISRKLHDYRKRQEEFEKLPRDDKDLVHRMRLFERFHTPKEHEVFLADILKAKRLRKEIAKLQMYRRMGLKSLLDVERYELDKSSAMLQKNTPASDRDTPTARSVTSPESSAYLKHYRTTDRKIRKSVNRGDTTGTPQVVSHPPVPSTEGEKERPRSQSQVLEVESTDPKEDTTTPVPMDIDSTDKPTEVAGLPEDLSQEEGFALLSGREGKLCRDVGLKPKQYLEIKRCLIQESLSKGMLGTKQSEGESITEAPAALVKLDVVRRGQVVEFVVQAGWIPKTAGAMVNADK